jgi:hypothetical protein
MNERSRQLIAELMQIQNRVENHHRDILTFAGLCNDKELEAYVQRHRASLPA